jgi:hypothetical protein
VLGGVVNLSQKQNGRMTSNGDFHSGVYSRHLCKCREFSASLYLLSTWRQPRPGNPKKQTVMSGYGSLDGSGPTQNKSVIIGLIAATGVVLALTIAGTALPQGKTTVSGYEVTTSAWKTCG